MPEGVPGNSGSLRNVQGYRADINATGISLPVYSRSGTIKTAHGYPFHAHVRRSTMPSSGPTGLPPELAALVHHVELNKAGWWDKAVEQFIIAALSASPTAIPRGGIHDVLRTCFGTEFNDQLVSAGVLRLVKRGRVLETELGKLALTNAARHEVEAAAKQAQKLESDAFERFSELLAANGAALDPARTWTTFVTQMLLPLITDMGARTYELVSGSSRPRFDSPRSEVFLASFPEKSRGALKETIVAFLAPDCTIGCSYVLRHLHAHFLVEAGTLTENQLRSLVASEGKAAEFNILVDTNFLFSLLGLHVNPSNEAALQLGRLISKLDGTVKCKLQVLPATIQEARRAITFSESQLQNMAIGPSLAGSALNAVTFGGLVQRYLEVCRENGSAIPASAYFAPYKYGLLELIKQRGVELIPDSADLRGYAMNRDVANDVVDIEQYLIQNDMRNRRFEEIRHDVVLWHVARDLRPTVLESPLEARYWVVTIDYRLLGFDERKRSSMRGYPPICLHPSSLTQMLQFFVPRTEQFEAAVLGNLRLPFLNQEFDPEVERVSLQILGALSRFSNAESIPPQTVGRVLVDEVLHSRIAGTNDGEQRVEIVKEALIEENKRVASDLAARSAEAEFLRREAHKLDVRVKELEAKNQSEGIARQDLESTLAKEAAARREIEERLTELRREIDQANTESRLIRARRRHALLWWMLPLPLLAAVCGVTFLLTPRWLPIRPWGTAAAATMAATALWLYIADKQRAANPSIANWAPAIKVHKVRRFVTRVLLVGVVASLIAAALWASVKTEQGP
jgi:hypothetical protein